MNKIYLPIIILLFLVYPQSAVRGLSVGDSYIKIICDVKDQTLLKEVGARWVKVRPGEPEILMDYEAYDSESSAKMLSKIEALGNSLDRICVQNTEQLRPVFREQVVKWISTGSVEFRPYTKLLTDDLTAGAAGCVYRPYERVGDWLVIGHFQRKFCLSDIFFNPFVLGGVASLGISMLVIIFHKRKFFRE